MGPSARSRAEARRGLYVHVPFCVRRCGYCDFATGALSAAAVERYLAAIEREAERRAPAAAGASFSSVFFGGGTPSALSSRHFRRLWKTVRDHFSVDATAEVSLEANPETVRPALLEAWSHAGVNRLSFGAQSFDALELERLGRLHGPERPGQAIRLAREHGFHRLSLDLMFGFPGHTMASWRRSLDEALALEPEHLSAYCFIPEPETPLGAATLGGREVPLEPETQADLYMALTERVEGAGYRGYETSNFARPGGECRHHLVYWLRRDYLALGPSAHGLWRGERYANHRDLGSWAAALARGADPDVREAVTSTTVVDETLMLALRLGTGLVASDHPRSVWDAIMARYGHRLTRGAAEGRLQESPRVFRIAPGHRFVADDVIAWLLAGAARGQAELRQAWDVETRGPFAATG